MGWNHFQIVTHSKWEVHKELTGHEAEDEAEADVDGVGGGPYPGVEHLCDHHPDQGPVSPITQKQEGH